MQQSSKNFFAVLKFYYLLLRTDILKKAVVRCPWSSLCNFESHVFQGVEGGSLSHIPAPFNFTTIPRDFRIHFRTSVISILKIVYFPSTASRANILVNVASRAAVKSRIPSRNFAFFRIPHECSSVNSQIPTMPSQTLVLCLIGRQYIHSHRGLLRPFYSDGLWHAWGVTVPPLITPSYLTTPINGRPHLVYHPIQWISTKLMFFSRIWLWETSKRCSFRGC